MDHDDVPVGRILGRREVLALIGAAGAGTLTRRVVSPPRADAAIVPTAWPMPSCVVRPAQTEGPYFVDGTLDRRDIRADPDTGAVPDGRSLDLEIRVSRVEEDSCTPLPGARVELWQCDALGVYSGVQDTDGRFDTRGKKFLRGHQLTDAAGAARFTTIYPGWYAGRAVHLHFSVRSKDAAGRDVLFTSQLYFDEAVTAAVLATDPYASKGTAGWRRNRADGIFSRSGGEQLMLATRPQGDGYAAVFELGMQLG